MVRKHSHFLPQIGECALFVCVCVGLCVTLHLSVECCLNIMLEVEDDEEWRIADKIGEDEDSSRFVLWVLCGLCLSNHSGWSFVATLSVVRLHWTDLLMPSAGRQFFLTSSKSFPPC